LFWVSSPIALPWQELKPQLDQLSDDFSGWAVGRGRNVYPQSAHIALQMILDDDASLARFV
jgi:hypothetical protein